MWDSFKGRVGWLTKAKRRRQFRRSLLGQDARANMTSAEFPWESQTPCDPRGWEDAHGWWSGTWGLRVSYAGQPDGHNKGAFLSTSRGLQVPSSAPPRPESSILLPKGKTIFSILCQEMERPNSCHCNCCVCQKYHHPAPIACYIKAPWVYCWK